ncbi:mitotic checkpoint serine/threonine-protein kinase BUB1 isoform X2 [Typha latifolia]|uniref:mitotic checkpoint serine/threonine-protein kinase BUB1 isoform X1 n=1 Tax=Typha latifolia TaxID=4733 RepID=UPI003C2FBB6D
MLHLATSPTTTSTSLLRSPRALQGTSSPRSLSDPILPWLRSVRKALDELGKDPDGAKYRLKVTVEECIGEFGDDGRYREDERLLKIWVLYADAIQDFGRVYGLLEEKGMFQRNALLYEAYAAFLIAKGDLLEAESVYQMGISRKAEPLDRLKKIHILFLSHVLEIAQIASSNPKVEQSMFQRQGPSSVNPWSTSSLTDLLKSLDSDIKKYNGYHRSNKPYSGKVSLTSLQNSSRNKIVELGNNKYQIKGCSGLGGFAQVYKAYVDSNPEEVVALKIQKPAFPWEFYMYRQLDKRIPDVERTSFGYAHKVHVFSDLSVLVCDYLSHGTLQDAINSHLVMQKLMEEVLCIYYTIEMLRMLETLHTAGIIHGDFKPDNLLVRYARETLTEDTFNSRTGSWRDQGLCLVDWGRGIDLSLFPTGTEFQGDCRTSGFRCVEMQESRTWTYQVDTYGLCVIVHMMLHGTYMSIEKKVNTDGSYQYQPKLPFKRYWNVDLWKNLFSTLLNAPSKESDVPLLQSLRKSFEEYLCSNPQLINKLKHLIVKQKASLCSA